MLLAEPFFSTSILPWHDLAFMYLRSSLSSLLSKDCVVLPRGASVMAAPGSYVYRCACMLVCVYVGVHGYLPKCSLRGDREVGGEFSPPMPLLRVKFLLVVMSRDGGSRLWCSQWSRACVE